MKNKIFRILAMAVFVLSVFTVQVFAQSSDCDSCNEPFDQVATGFGKASINKHAGSDQIGVNGGGYASGNYNTKSDLEADGSDEAWTIFSFEITSDENKASVLANIKSEGAAETSPINGPSVIGQESYAKQSNGATIIKNDDNGFSAGNYSLAETSGEKTEDCGDGISIVGTSEALGRTRGEMTSGDGFKKTIVQTGGNSSAIGPNGHVGGGGNYAANAGIEKSGALAYSELSGSWKYSGVQSGNGIGDGISDVLITETEGSIRARSHTRSYSAASTPGQ